MLESNSSAAACLVVTTSGRILLLWDQDDTLPFQYPQLAMLLASLFHFAQAQSFGHLELQNGFTVVISSDVDAQVSVAVICATPSAAIQGNSESSGDVEVLQLGRLKSLIILQEFVRRYRRDIERLAAESVEQAKLMAEEYTLTSVLGGFQDMYDGTLDEFVAFQNDFVGLVMETTAPGIQNSITSWNQHGTVIMAQCTPAIRLARGFLMNAESGNEVYSTPIFFDQDSVSRKLHHLHKSARVQQLTKRVAKGLYESALALIGVTRDNNTAVVVKFSHLLDRDVSELFVALRMLPTGVFSTGVVFYGNNALFRGRESELCCSGKLQQVLAAHPGSKTMLNVLHDPSTDIELHVGTDGAPEEVWKAMDLLVRPFTFSLSTSSVATKFDRVGALSSGASIDTETDSKQSASPRLPQRTK